MCLLLSGLLVLLASSTSLLAMFPCLLVMIYTGLLVMFPSAPCLLASLPCHRRMLSSMPGLWRRLSTMTGLQMFPRLRIGLKMFPRLWLASRCSLAFGLVSRCALVSVGDLAHTPDLAKDCLSILWLPGNLAHVCDLGQVRYSGLVFVVSPAQA